MFKLTKIAFFALFLAFGSSVFAAEYVAKVKPGVAFTLDQIEGYSVTDIHAEGSLILVSIDAEDEPFKVAAMLAKEGVEYVVPNFKLHRLTKAVSPSALKEQYHIAKVRAEEAWGLAGHKGKKEIIVAVIDTGVDYNHEVLAPNMVDGYDFAENDDDPMDKTSAQNPGHGTHCAGIVGATGDVDNSTIGIAPGISMMPIRFLDERGSGDLMNGIKAIDYAIANGAKVISASWGAGVSESQAKPLIEAVKRASDAGVVFVAAAANDGKNNDKVSMYPANARFENTITVAASDISDKKPSWSNYGRANVDIAAPGHEIVSTLPGKYGTLSGTSMATPVISGTVAFLLSENPELSGAQVLSLMQTSAAKVDIETACKCRVDVAEAYKAVKEEQMTVVPAAASIEPGSTKVFGAAFANGDLSFESTNPEVATIAEDGTLTAVKEGELKIKVTDAQGTSAESLAIYIAKKGSGGGGPGNPPGGECPFPDEATCKIACDFMPTLPWCSLN